MNGKKGISKDFRSTTGVTGAALFRDSHIKGLWFSTEESQSFAVVVSHSECGDLPELSKQHLLVSPWRSTVVPEDGKPPGRERHLAVKFQVMFNGYLKTFSNATDSFLKTA